MRKRICKGLALLAALALLPTGGAVGESPSFAESDYVSLGELAKQAMEGWHETFAVNGREVMANVAIHWMPETDACPIVEATPGTVLDNPALLAPYQGKANSVDVHPDKHWLGIQVDTWKEIFFIPPYSANSGETRLANTVEFDSSQAPKGTPEGLDIPCPSLLTFLNSHIEPLCGLTANDFFFEGSLRDALWKVRETNGEVVRVEPVSRNGSWHLRGRQLVGGIPVLRAMDTPLSGYLNLNYYGAECYQISVFPVAQTAVVADDVPLLSFNAFKRVLRAQIEAGNLWSVDEMQFGYAPYRGKDDAHWVLQPTWRVLGGYTQDPNTPENVLPYQDPRDADGSLSVPENYRYYHYNAQTGEMLDAQSDSPLAWNVLTWEDVAE